MDWWQALVLGVVEGVTEFLPISSTGHLILFSRLLGVSESQFATSFEIIIQLGAILAVAVRAWQRRDLVRAWWRQIIVAFVPTAVVGLVLYKIITRVFLTSEWLVVAMLFVGGLALIGFEYWQRRRPEVVAGQIGWRQAALIGCAQALAVVPGVSRAAATVVGGLALGLPRAVIVEFSFLLAIPTMAAATGLNLLKNSFSFSAHEWLLLALGFAAAFASALLAIKFLLRFISRHDFTSFGIYRIVIAILFALYLL